MENQESKPIMILSLSKEDLQQLCEKAAVMGAKTGIEKYEEEIARQQKQKGDRKLHNTKLLLRNYRMLQLHAENSVFGRSQMQESASDIIENMMSLYNDELIVESIKNSATRTAIIVGHIKTMVDIYGICCERSNNVLDRRRFDIIYSLYISDSEITRKELMDKWNISVDTTYLDEKIANERLSALIFGVDGL